MELVGRDGELGVVATLLDDARRTGTAGIVTVVGDPGSGKSSLLAAVDRALRTVAVTGYLAERHIPFAASADVLRQLAVVGQPSDLLSSSATPLPLLEATHRAIRKRPTVLLLDDAQWVDSHTRALVHYLLRAAVADGTVLVVVAATRPVADGLAFLRSLVELAAPAAMVELELAPLEPRLGAQLATRLRPDLDHEQAIAIAERAGGSPYWITSLVQDDGRGLEARLDMLTSDAIELLAGLVVASRLTEPALLADVLGWPPHQVDDMLDELVAAGLAVRRRGQAGVAHDLIREAMEATLPMARSESLHRRFAEVLCSTPEADLDDLQLALSHQRAAGAEAIDIARRLLDHPRRSLLGPEGLVQLVGELRHQPSAVQSSLGDLSMSLGEHAIAQQRFTAAAERAADEASRAAATVQAAQAAHLLGDDDAATVLLRRARTGGADAATRVEANLLEAALSRWSLHDLTTARALTSRALAALPADPRADSERWRRIRLSALDAAHDDAMMADDVPEPLRLAQLRSELAVDRDERLLAAVAMMNAWITAGHVHEALDAARDLLEQARRAGRPTVVLTATHGLARSLRELGRVAEAAATLPEAVAVERRIGARPGARRLGDLMLALQVSAGATGGRPRGRSPTTSRRSRIHTSACPPSSTNSSPCLPSQRPMTPRWPRSWSGGWRTPRLRGVAAAGRSSTTTWSRRGRGPAGPTAVPRCGRGPAAPTATPCSSTMDAGRAPSSPRHPVMPAPPTRWLGSSTRRTPVGGCAWRCGPVWSWAGSWPHGPTRPRPTSSRTLMTWPWRAERSTRLHSPSASSAPSGHVPGGAGPSPARHPPAPSPP